MTPADASSSSARDPPARRALLRPRRARDLRRRVRRADARAAGARGRRIPICVTPDSPTQRVGGRPAEGFATVEHLVADALARQRLQRRGAARVRRARAARPRTRREPVAYVAELKIDGLSIALTYEDGRLVRGATRGNGVARRGRHAERAHGAGDSVDAARAARRAASRFAARCTCRRSAFERINKEQEDAGEPLYANRAQHGGRDDAQPRPVAGRQARSARRGPIRSCGRPAPATRRRTPRCSTRTEALGRAGRAALEDAARASTRSWRSARSGARSAATLTFETDGVVDQGDDLALRERLGYTSKFPRWATAFKFPAERKVAMLHRIEINIGRTGAATPFAVLEPMVVARLDDLDGDAAQPRRHHPQGHPPGRAGHHREGRRRDPARRRARPIRTRRIVPARWVMPTTCPVVRQPAAEAGRRSRVAVREQLVPGEAAARARALRLARRDEHRGHGRIAHRAACRPAASSQSSPTSIALDAPSARGPRADGQEVRGEAARRDREVEGQRRLAAALRPRHPPCRRARRAGAGRPLRLDRRDRSGVARGAAAGAARSARCWPRRCGRGSTSRRNRELLERLAARRA